MRLARSQQGSHGGDTAPEVRQAECDVGPRGGTTSERENRELKRADETLRKASAYFASGLGRRQK